MDEITMRYRSLPKHHLSAKKKCWSINWVEIKFSIHSAAAAAAKSLQSCPTRCDPIDGSPPGSPVPGILQARTLEWVAISFSNAWKWKAKVKSLSQVQLLATPWTAVYQAPPSMGFDLPGMSTGVGCHFLPHCMKVKSLSRVRLFATPFTQLDL